MQKQEIRGISPSLPSDAPAIGEQAAEAVVIPLNREKGTMQHNLTPTLGIVALILTSIFGCTTAGTVPRGREEVANRLIMEIDSGIDSACADRTIGSKEQMPAPNIRGVYESVNQERWNLIRCGKTVPYIVIFAREFARSGGRTDVRVRPEHEPTPEIVYVRNVAKRNHCELIGEPLKTVRPGSTRRYYEVTCTSGVMNFVCGPIEEGSSGEACWRM